MRTRISKRRRWNVPALIGPLRTKEELEPTMPLPRWTAWAMIAWTLGTAAVYTAILAHWWE